jgi:hypothetical protein
VGDGRAPQRSGGAQATDVLPFRVPTRSVGMTQPAQKESRAFVGGAVVLVIIMLTCGVFAGLAGKHIGNKDVDFAIAFAFLGLLVVGIFTLAWLDTTTKSGDHEFMRGHGH